MNQREHNRRYAASEKGRAKKREWYARNRDKVAALRRSKGESVLFREYKRDWQLRTRYGITAEQYDSMLASQEGVCAICRTPPAGGRRLAVDHCHTTGTVRGLLCDKCNNGIARFADDPQRLHRAIEYLAAVEAPHV